MKIKVRIFGEVGRVVGNRHVVELEDHATVLRLIKIIQKKSGQTRGGYLGEFMVGGVDLAIIVNGKNIALGDGLDTVLKDEDDVVITPYVSGG
ncbi:MAG: MoaD/ThiS family protein [Candidatus Bathyarchaeota archaeon]|nr:MoaD/ThiS family protein [Candidatus Bathyarchaeota archaeon]